MKNNKNFRVGSEAQYGPRPAGEILHENMENSMALYPDTHLCVNVKLLTRKRGRMPVGRYLIGIITHDEAEHFTFIEKLPISEMYNEICTVLEGLVEKE